MSFNGGRFLLICYDINRISEFTSMLRPLLWIIIIISIIIFIISLYTISLLGRSTGDQAEGRGGGATSSVLQCRGSRAQSQSGAATHSNEEVECSKAERERTVTATSEEGAVAKGIDMMDWVFVCVFFVLISAIIMCVAQINKSWWYRSDLKCFCFLRL